MCFYKPVKCCIVRLFIIIVATPLILLALFLVASTLVIATIIVNVVSFIALLSLLLLYCCFRRYKTAHAQYCTMYSTTHVLANDTFLIAITVIVITALLLGTIRKSSHTI